MKFNTLILLSKYPVAWKVKTRLGKIIGMQSAANFQRACLHKLIETFRDQRNYSLIIWLRSEEFLNQFSEEFSIPVSNIFIQQWEDLWETMHHALSYGLSLSKHVCLIGSDTPLLETDTVNHAFQTLQNYDTVIGPSDDGWYYLIGSSTPIQDVLIGIVYSTTTVYTETVDRFDGYGHSFSVLPTLLDIDTYEALQQANQDDTTWRIEDVTQTLKIDMNR
jgi:rSAM/selenodomain-associated transferase 1